jgi:glucose-6-phosphate 1-dehydrogenase
MSSAAAGAGPAAAIAESTTEDAYSVFVLGASGDLAHKKTYPSLYDLFREGLLPPRIVIIGYARSAIADDTFRETLRKHVKGGTPEQLESFLSLCIYRQGKYDDVEAFRKVRRRRTLYTPSNSGTGDRGCGMKAIR